MVDLILSLCIGAKHQPRLGRNSQLSASLYIYCITLLAHQRPSAFLI